MASRASSERPYPRVLPSNVRPLPVKLLGTTWVERGAAYKWRRVGILIGRLWIVLLMSIFAIGGAQLIVNTLHSTGWRNAALAGATLCAVLGFAWGIREVRRLATIDLTPEQWAERQRSFQLRFPWLRSPALLYFILILLLPASGPFLFGFIAAYFIGASCGHELAAERGARLQFESELREHGKLRSQA
jgi:hypothetical protein